MKIRNGFVSNSSSSSFLIKLGENYPDVLAVATSMIKDRFDDWKSEDNSSFYDDGREASVYKDIERLRKHGNVNMPIFFRSTNYDTFITPLTDNYVFVDTCNNIQWKIQHISGAAVYSLPDEVKVKYPEAEGYYGDIEIKVKRDTEYYLLEHGLMAWPTPTYTTCKKCYQEIWIIDNVEYCVDCDWDAISRGIKLDKLKSLINMENSK